MKQNDIPSLPQLGSYAYENIFNVYQDSGYYFYNILNSVYIDTIDPSYCDAYTVNSNKPWTIISYEIYGTIELWWLICAVNKIDNPVQLPESGTLLKVVKPGYISVVIENIKNSI